MTEFPDEFRPLNVLLGEMEAAMNAGHYYLALHFAVSLPDICAALAEPPLGFPGKGVEGRYVDWCRKYLEPKYSMHGGRRIASRGVTGPCS